MSDESRTALQRTETEYLIMVDYGGRGGIFGSERRDRFRSTEAAVLAEAREVLRDHAVKVEVFSREVTAEWTKVEELS